MFVYFNFLYDMLFGYKVNPDQLLKESMYGRKAVYLDNHIQYDTNVVDIRPFM